jgi:hypothetical protein
MLFDAYIFSQSLLPMRSSAFLRSAVTIVMAIFFSLSQTAEAQNRAPFRIAKLKYEGGGDWYANKTALPNLISFVNDQMGLNITLADDVVEVGSPELFNYPYLYMTGHGNVVLSNAEAENLRSYLVSGGFLHIDDNYGLFEYLVPEMRKVFPEIEFVELPYDHPIYRTPFLFEEGLPKIHEHDGEPAQGLGLIYQGRLVCFFSYQCDLGNGWEDSQIHNNPEELRQKALKMGANLILFAFTQS